MAQLRREDVRNRLLQILAPDDFTLMAPRLQLVPIALRQPLFEPNQPIAELYFPESGLASITTALPADEIEVGMIGREGLVAATPIVLGDDLSPYKCFVQMEGEAFRISTRDLRDATRQSPTLLSLLLRFVQAFSVQTAQTAFANAAYTIEGRLARWLLMYHDRGEGDRLFITHEFLSIMLGVRRPGVTVAVQILENSGLINASRGRITILDRQRLVMMAGEAYGLAEAEYERLMGSA